MNRELIQQFDRLKRNERHRNNAETAYWCNQYKLLAQKLLDELSKPANEFHPDWDTLKPYHDRIAELEAQLAKPEYPDLRKAAEMALESLLDANNMALMELSIDDAYSNEIDTLRQALAQPEQDHGFDRTASHMAGEYVDTAQSKAMHEACIEASMRNAQSEQEPVAWHYHNPDYPIQDGDWVEVIFTSGQPDDAKKWTPLYTAPNVSIKQQNINTSEERVHKSEGCVHEPVAWRWLHNGKPDSNKCFDGTGPTEEAISNASSAEFPRSVQYFYTAPQNPDVTLTDEGKTWQGLTDEEISLMAHNDDEGDWSDLRYRDCWYKGYLDGARAIEAKLREKNT